MGKILAITLALPVVAAAGAAAFVTHQNIQTYEAESLKSLNEANASLRQQGLKFNYQLVSSSWFGAVREELYTLSNLQDGSDLLAIRQNATIEPFTASGTFGLDPKTGLVAMLLAPVPQFTAQQKGEWHLDMKTQEVVTHYQSGPVSYTMPGASIQLSPLMLDSTTDLNEGHRTKAVLSLGRTALSRDQNDSRVALNDLSVEVRSHTVGNQPFLDRAVYRVGNVEVSDGSRQLRLAGFNTTVASLLDKGIYSMLISTGIQNLKTSTEDKDLSVDPSSLRLFVDGLNWQALEKTGELLAESDPEQVSAMEIVSALQAVGAAGAAVTLEDLNYSFMLNDRGPDAMSASGDIRAKGFARLNAGEAETLRHEWMQRTDAALSLDLSRSLMQGPFAEHMVGLIDAGYLREEGDRLISDLRFQNGSITANNLPLDGLLAAE